MKKTRPCRKSASNKPFSITRWRITPITDISPITPVPVELAAPHQPSSLLLPQPILPSLTTLSDSAPLSCDASLSAQSDTVVNQTPDPHPRTTINSSNNSNQSGHPQIVSSEISYRGIQTWERLLWSKDEIQRLITWLEENHDLTRSSRPWLSKLAQEFPHHTASRVKNKYNSMLRLYRQTKAMAIRSGFGLRADKNKKSVNELLQKKCPFFFRLEAVYGDRANGVYPNSEDSVDFVLVMETASPPNQGGRPGRVINPNGTETHDTNTTMSDSGERSPENENRKKRGGKNSAEREGVIHNPETPTINRGKRDIIGADSEAENSLTEALLRSPSPSSQLPICPAEGCGLEFPGKNPRHSMARHLRYLAHRTSHPRSRAHLVAYQGKKIERATSEEKQKKSRKKYRENNKEKTTRASRLANFKAKARRRGIRDRDQVEQLARGWMEDYDAKNVVGPNDEGFV